MPRVHDQRTTTFPASAHLGGRPDRRGCPVIEHPPWCSPQHCFLDENGVRVHEQEPVRWEECEVRFESRLLFPDDERPPTTYLQLSIENLRFTWRCVDIEDGESRDLVVYEAIASNCDVDVGDGDVGGCATR